MRFPGLDHEHVSGGEVGGYDNGARFVWWYQHHCRLASDGSTYAAYFGVAITVQNGHSAAERHRPGRIG